MEDFPYSVEKVDGVSIGEDPGFQARWSKFTRIVWFVLLVFVLLGAAGILGKGPLASTTSGTPQDPMYVRYDRFARFQSSAILRIVITPNAVLRNHDEVWIFVSSSLVDSLDPRKFNPHPVATQLTAGGEIFKYQAEANQTLRLDLVQLLPRFGILRGNVSLPGQTSVPIRQIVYP